MVQCLDLILRANPEHMKVSATIRDVIVASLLAAGGFLMAAVTAVLLAGGL